MQLIVLLGAGDTSVLPRLTLPMEAVPLTSRTVDAGTDTDVAGGR
jgi:hypothetical protein